MKNVVVAIKQWLAIGQRLLWLEYGLLALVILLPLLLPGYILTLDMVFTPHFALPSEPTNTAPLDVLLWLASRVLPGDALQKIILFLILVFAGAGAHRLVVQYPPARIPVETWRLATYFAGIFYMINPFTYGRFMAGQWLVLAGYALLPFFAASLLKLLKIPTLRSALLVAAWAVAAVTFSIHHVGMIALLSLVTLCIGVVAYRHQKSRQRTFLTLSSFATLLFLLATLFWWLPMTLGGTDAGRAVADFTQADATAFATSGHGGLGALGDVVRLQGFWVEAQRLFTLPQAVTPLWGVVVLLLWILVIAGVATAWRGQRNLVLLSISCIGLGVVLAVTPVLQWLAQVVPLLAGYREPHKFAGLIALGYAVLGAYGAAWAIQTVTRKHKSLAGQGVLIGCLLLPLVITPTMLWGFAGQLTPRHYPSEWHAMNAKLAEIPGSKTLFLPWHQYMTFNFSGRLIANPAEKFFEPQMLSSDLPEFKNLSPTVPHVEKAVITKVLAYPETLPSTLRSYGITHILVAKEYNYKTYNYLQDLPGMQRISEDEKLLLYEVAAS